MVKDQENFSSKYSQMYDVEIRTQKALKALSIIDDFKIDTDGLTLLDIGCSSGIMTKIYSKYFSKTIGIDIDKSAIDFAINNFNQENLKFFNISYNSSELQNKKFDVSTKRITKNGKRNKYCLIPSYEIGLKIKNIKLTIEIIYRLNFPSTEKYLFL